jgi:hypothetical protein
LRLWESFQGTLRRDSGARGRGRPPRWQVDVAHQADHVGLVQTYLGVGQTTGKIQTNIKMAEPKWVYFLYTALVWKDRPQRTR